MPIWLQIVLPVAGIFLGWLFRWLYAIFQLSAAEQKAERVLLDVVNEAEKEKKEVLLQGREELLREKTQQERELRERRNEVQRYERRMQRT